MKNDLLNYLRQAWCNGERWRAFFHSRLWIGLPVAPVVMFLAVFFTRHYADGMPVASAFVKAAYVATCGVLCYAIGVYAAVNDDPEPLKDAEQQHFRRFGIFARLFDWLIVVAVLVLFCYSTVASICTGEVTLAHGLTGLFIKVVAVGAVVVPVAIEHRRR